MLEAGCLSARSARGNFIDVTIWRLLRTLWDYYAQHFEDRTWPAAKPPSRGHLPTKRSTNLLRGWPGRQRNRNSQYRPFVFRPRREIQCSSCAGSIVLSSLSRDAKTLLSGGKKESTRSTGRAPRTGAATYHSTSRVCGHFEDIIRNIISRMIIGNFPCVFNKKLARILVPTFPSLNLS